MWTLILALLCGYARAWGSRNGSASLGPELPMPVHSVQLNRTRGYLMDERSSRRLTQQQDDRGVMDPLYRGFGTHYAFVWVGSPPQRVSVIVDTGSHWTAFPCTGCQCGRHMDSYFDTSKSSTANVLTCGAKAKCYFSQSYSEGSSWRAYKVTDKVWVGGSLPGMVADADALAMDFTFGCQERETGLFRTQMVDGIMGLSASADTLPFKMFERKAAKSKAFSMCYRVGGGILNLGGVDPSLSKGPVVYAKLQKTSGWFTVKMLKVSLRSSDGKQEVMVMDKAVVLGSGSGTIVDSGTTDTYLPAAMRTAFVAAFSKLTKGAMAYSNKLVTLTDDQVDALPTIVFKMEGRYGEPVEVEMPPSSYTETAPGGGGNKRNFRVYVTEPRGTVLGANFMNDQNVIFDIQNQRVGFSKSDCHFRNHYHIGDGVRGAARKMDDTVNAIFQGKKQDTKRTSGVVKGGVNSVGILPAILPAAKNEGEGGHRVVPKADSAATDDMWSSSGASSDSAEEKAVTAGLRLSVDPTDFVHIEELDCSPDPRAKPLSACMASCLLEPSSTDSRAEARLVNHGAGSGATSTTDQMSVGPKTRGMYKNYNEQQKAAAAAAPSAAGEAAKGKQLRAVLASGFIADGYQLWVDRCWQPRIGVAGVPGVTGLGKKHGDGGSTVAEGVVSKACYVHCSREHRVVAQSPQSSALALNVVMQQPEDKRVDGNCYSEHWSLCGNQCKQKRRAGRIHNSTTSATQSGKWSSIGALQQKIQTSVAYHAPTGYGICRWEMQTRQCYADQCPMSFGDHKMVIDLRVHGITPAAWSSVHDTDMEVALATLFETEEAGVRVFARTADKDRDGQLTETQRQRQQKHHTTIVRLRAVIRLHRENYRLVVAAAEMGSQTTPPGADGGAGGQGETSNADMAGEANTPTSTHVTILRKDLITKNEDTLPTVSEMSVMAERLVKYANKGEQFSRDLQGRLTATGARVKMDWSWVSPDYILVADASFDVQRGASPRGSSPTTAWTEDTVTELLGETQYIPPSAVVHATPKVVVLDPQTDVVTIMINWWVYLTFLIGFLVSVYGVMRLCFPHHQLLPSISWAPVPRHPSSFVDGDANATHSDARGGPYGHYPPRRDSWEDWDSRAPQRFSRGSWGANKSPLDSPRDPPPSGSPHSSPRDSPHGSPRRQRSRRSSRADSWEMDDRDDRDHGDDGDAGDRGARGARDAVPRHDDRRRLSHNHGHSQGHSQGQSRSRSGSDHHDRVRRSDRSSRSDCARSESGSGVDRSRSTSPSPSARERNWSGDSWDGDDGGGDGRGDSYGNNNSSSDGRIGSPAPMPVGSAIPPLAPPLSQLMAGSRGGRGAQSAGPVAAPRPAHDDSGSSGRHGW